MTPGRIDQPNGVIVFRTLKQRGRVSFRALPVPRYLLGLIATISPQTDERIWPWGRTKAWKVVKGVMRETGISEVLCKPKALRHAFAVEAGQKSVPLNMVQRWLGHARIETTLIYASAVGQEERNLAGRAWHSFDAVLVASLACRRRMTSSHDNQRKFAPLKCVPEIHLLDNWFLEQRLKNPCHMCRDNYDVGWIYAGSNSDRRRIVR